jgi:hypothetical protein
MSTIKPILFATLPIYAMMSLMIIAMAAVYQIVEDIAVNYPVYSLSALSLLFFAMIMIGIAPSVVTSRFMKRHNLQDVRIQLPAHWQKVILDVVAWVRIRVYSQILLMFGFMGIFWAISGAAIYSLRAVQASTLDYLVVILVATFVGLFLFSTGRVLYRSALVPVDVVQEDGLDSILRALPVMGPRRVEFLKKARSDVIPPRAMKVMGGLYALGAAGLGVSAAAPFLGFPSLTIPGIIFATTMMMLGMTVVFASFISNRKSVLSRALGPDREVETK